MCDLKPQSWPAAGSSHSKLRSEFRVPSSEKSGTPTPHSGFRSGQHILREVNIERQTTLFRLSRGTSAAPFPTMSYLQNTAANDG